MRWKLIFAYGSEVHVFDAEGDNPQELALQVMRESCWLDEFILVAAVQGDPKILVADSARTAECGLQ